MTDDRLAEIKAFCEEHDYADGLFLDDVRWLVGEVERLRVVAGEASPREILGLPEDPGP